MWICYQQIFLSVKWKTAAYLSLSATLFLSSTNTKRVPHQTGIDTGLWRIDGNTCVCFQTCPTNLRTPTEPTTVSVMRDWWGEVSGMQPEGCSGAEASQGKESKRGEVTHFPLLILLLCKEPSSSWGIALREKSSPSLPQPSMHQGISSIQKEALDVKRCRWAFTTTHSDRNTNH